MIREAWNRWRPEVAKPGVWTVIVWTVIFGLVVYALFALAGDGRIFTQIIHPGSTATAKSISSKNVAPVIVVYLVMLVFGPFWMAGGYGLLGGAIHSEPVGWRTFWIKGRKLYGRGWGLILYSILYGFVVLILAVALLTTLSVIGGVILGALVVLSLPFIVRMTGALFVDLRGWGESFRESFRGGKFWGLLGGLLVALVAYAILYIIVVLLEKVSTPLAVVVYILVELGFAVMAPLWMFALYDVSHKDGVFIEK